MRKGIALLLCVALLLPLVPAVEASQGDGFVLTAMSETAL